MLMLKYNHQKLKEILLLALLSPSSIFCRLLSFCRGSRRETRNRTTFLTINTHIVSLKESKLCCETTIFNTRNKKVIIDQFINLYHSDKFFIRLVLGFICTKTRCIMGLTVCTVFQWCSSVQFPCSVTWEQVLIYKLYKMQFSVSIQNTHHFIIVTQNHII